MMEPNGGHRNKVIKQQNAIVFGLVWFVFTCTFRLDGNQDLQEIQSLLKDNLFYLFTFMQLLITTARDLYFKYFKVKWR